jgi:peptidyl-prolyl cis-trans isomerase C
VAAAFLIFLTGLKMEEYTRMRKVLLLVFFAATAFARTQQSVTPPGSQSTPAPQGEASTQATPTAQPESGLSTLLAEADDYRLTEGDFNAILRLLPAQQRPTTPALKEELVKRWMMVVVCAEEEKAKGVDKDPAFIQEMELYKTQQLFARYQRDLLVAIPPVTPEEAQKYYEENKAMFVRPATARVSRILLPTKEKAEEAKKALNSGQSFEDVVKAFSIDGASKDNGGDLGWVKPGVTEPAFDQTVASLSANQISEPFETKLGWQIIKVSEKKEAVQIEFSQIRDQLSQELTAKKRREALDAKTQELFQKHNVKILGDTK